MYAAVVSSALVAGLLAAGSVLPGTDAAGEQRAVVEVAPCAHTAYLSAYPAMDAAERHSCQSTYTPYVAPLASR